MLTGLPIGPLLTGLGPWAVAAAICWWITRLVLKGKLVPRSHLEDVQADRDHNRDLADTWQRVATQHGMTLERHTETLEKLLANDEAILHVVKEIQEAGKRTSGGGSA